MKTSKIASFFAFLALTVLALGFASAQSLTFTPNSINQAIVAGQNAVILFNLTGPIVSNHTWTTQLSQGGTISNPPTPLPYNITSQTPITITFSSLIYIPPTASGQVTGSITFTGVNSSGATITASLPVIVTVIQPASNLTITNMPTNALSVRENFTFTVTNTGGTTLSNIVVSESTNPAFGGLTFAPNGFELLQGSNKAVTAILSSLRNLKFGENLLSIKAVDSSGQQSQSAGFKVKKTFCSAGETLLSNISIEEINRDNSGEGDSDTWELFDEIEVEVKVQNNDQEDDLDVTLELGLFDESGNNVADDLTYTKDSEGDDEEIDLSLDDDSDETVKWVFKVPADFDAGNYKMAVKVYNEDEGESKDCKDSSNDLKESYYQNIEIKEASDEGRFVVVDEIEMGSQFTCGQTVTGQFTVYNIGEDNQDRVKIIMRNKELGIEAFRELTSDLDKGDDETLDFAFQIPATAKNGNYVIEFITQYDYKNGVYREDSEDSFDMPFEVIGCSQNLGTGPTGSGLSNVNINAKLDSEAKAGKELVVVATIKNTGNKEATYGLSARGYSSWAELTDISESTINLDAGESAEVTFKLAVNSDAKGTKSFDIQVSSEGKVMIQEVEVKLSEAKSLFESGNSLIWIIGLINLILIILIIVVAVRMARK